MHWRFAMRFSAMPKPRNCRCGCGQPIPGANTLRIAATLECALKLGKATRERQEVKQRQAERRALREARERIKPLSALCKEARAVVQKWARIRDAKYGVCICCGAPRIDDGGHYYPVGSKYRTSRLSLNPDQIHGCCSKCNRFVGGGNVHAYTEGLIARYGPQKIAELQELKRRADHGEDAPLTRDEVNQIKKDYLLKIRGKTNDGDEM